MVLDSVTGKIAIVTGGASGIGFAFVKLLVSNKCNVVIGDLRLLEDSRALVDSTSSSSDGKVLFKQTDVTKWDQLADLFSFTQSSLGVPDIVCPGAGIYEPKWSSFWDDTETDSYKTIAINCDHPVKATRLAVRAFLKANKPGVVVHISSMGGQISRINVPIYCATKAFINSFVRSMTNLEAKANIKVVAVAPGLVDTPLWHVENPERVAAVAGASWITPAEIAEVLLDLCVNPEYAGGTILEATGEGRRRRVEAFNDPGPPGTGTGLQRETDNPMDEPVYELLKTERGTS